MVQIIVFAFFLSAYATFSSSSFIASCHSLTHVRHVIPSRPQLQAPSLSAFGIGNETNFSWPKFCTFIHIYYIPKQWIALLARSDWLRTGTRDSKCYPSPHCRRPVVGIYPPLATDTEVNSR